MERHNIFSIVLVASAINGMISPAMTIVAIFSWIWLPSFMLASTGLIFFLSMLVTATATLLLLRLGALTAEPRYRAAADGALATMAPFLARYPTAFAQWLCALELAHAGITEIAVIGDRAAAETRRLITVADRGYHPFRVLACAEPGTASVVPLLVGRFALHGRATAFVCRDFACRQPVHEPEALAALLVGR